jgi:hypothetical protein
MMTEYLVRHWDGRWLPGKLPEGGYWYRPDVHGQRFWCAANRGVLAVEEGKWMTEDGLHVDAIDYQVKYGESAALMFLLHNGQINGAHHKAWVIDQAVRLLAVDEYERVIAEACAGEDGPDTYSWDCGIIP